MRKALKYTLLLLFVGLFCHVGLAQTPIVAGYTIERGDTVYHFAVPTVVIFPRPKYKNEKAKQEYRRLVYNFKQVYPYALKAKLRLQQIDSTMLTMKNEKQRKAYLKEQEKILFKEFEAPLKKLTYSQGRLLMRLIDREAGQTSYYLVKNLKGSITAFFWQGVAKLFGADLKKPYDKYGEDKPIEELVIMYKNGTFDIYYYQVMNN